MTSPRECTNCDGRKCMDCVLRYGHDECVDDCPFCCPAFRVLVTGSRDWDDVGQVCNALNAALLESQAAGRTTFIVIHGACPTGADLVAGTWANASRAPEGMRIQNEPHPAEWHLYGKAAGPIRNLQMVHLGADLCLAFIKNSSRGATHCASEAYKAGVLVRTWRA